jgi:hypothetical protein
VVPCTSGCTTARRVVQITLDHAIQFKRLGARLALEPISEQALRT